MDNAKTRSKKPIKLSTAMSRHVDTALYLFGAEIRFRSYCVWLYCHKRPRLMRNYVNAFACGLNMVVLAVAAQVFM